jgi:hypothetical protein
METTKESITGTTTIEEDPISGDLFLTFPDEVAEAVGMNDWEWVNWDLQPDGTVLITKGQGPDAGDEGDHF